MNHPYPSEKQPNHSESLPEKGFGLRCRIECLRSNRSLLGRRGNYDTIEKGPCEFIGALTGVECIVVAGVEEGEIVVEANRLIPCTKDGEQTAVGEGLPPTGPILRPFVRAELPPAIET